MTEKPAKHFVSLNEYARIRGVTASQVELAIKNERIKRHKVMNKLMIEVNEANADWEATTRPMIDSKEYAEPDNKKRGYPSFQESRAIREAYTARITKLEYEEKSTKLVDLQRIKDINFDVARRVRNAILNVPGNINAEVAVETDPHKCEMLIYNALSDALELAATES